MENLTGFSNKFLDTTTEAHHQRKIVKLNSTKIKNFSAKDIVKGMKSQTTLQEENNHIF